jgi:predicted nuclease of restriction endonuclease-like (RecB) superfamily
MITYGKMICQITDPKKQERFRLLSIKNENEGLAEPFKGISGQAGQIQDGLFQINSTGVSTSKVQKAANTFLKTLNNDQQHEVLFPIDDDEWRKWMNQHFYVRQGIGFVDMSEKQRQAAFDLMRSSLSAKGLKLSRDIMRLNHTLGEINNNFEEYGEWLYWITIMGNPSDTEPWGWQMDGHHLIINYFVLGDQVVMTPLFVGSEPVIAESGKYKGIQILQTEQQSGLDMIRSLDQEQQNEAVIEVSKDGNNNLTEAFKDNVVLDYAGVSASSFTKKQKEQLLQLIKLFVDNMDEGHAKVKMEEVANHIDDTWFAWIGGHEDKAVFYYRVHSPVLLIEFDHQKPVGTRQLYGTQPHHQHIHVVVRTPNGNDYGKDLLKQHYQEHPHH